MIGKVKRKKRCCRPFVVRSLCCDSFTIPCQALEPRQRGDKRKARIEEAERLVDKRSRDDDSGDLVWVGVGSGSSIFQVTVALLHG